MNRYHKSTPVQALFTLLLLAHSLGATASMIERDLFVELTDVSADFGYSALSGSVALDERLVLDLGDTLVLNFTFAGGLRYEDLGTPSDEYLGFSVVSDGSGESTGYLFDTNFLFTVFSGDLTQNNITFGFGGPLGGFLPNFNLTDSALDVFSLTTTTTIDFKEPGRGTFNSQEVNFFAAIFPDGEGVVSVVPAPATLSLLGLGLLGLRLRRNY